MASVMKLLTLSKTKTKKMSRESNWKISTFQLQKLLAELLSVIKTFGPELNLYSIKCK